MQTNGLNKYCFEIQPLQRCGQDFAHAQYIPTSVMEPQTGLRKHSTVFTFVII